MAAPRTLFVLLVGAALMLAACDSDSESNTAPLGTPIDPFSAATLDLSQRTGIPEDQIEAVSTSSTNWPDACLGLATEGEVCAQVITRGYRVVLEAGGTRYVYRTDLSSLARFEGEAPP